MHRTQQEKVIDVIERRVKGLPGGVGQQGQAPTGYAPAPTAGYQPAPSTGYKPAPSSSYQPAQQSYQSAPNYGTSSYARAPAPAPAAAAGGGSSLLNRVVQMGRQP